MPNNHERFNHVSGQHTQPLIGKHAWDIGAEIWTNELSHPVMPRDRDAAQKQAIRTHLSPFIPQLETAQHILDIGSGGGTHFYLPESLSSKVTAIDFSTEMLKRNSSARKMQADAQKFLPIRNNSVEAVTQFFLNRYFTEEEQVQELAEIARVLTRKGIILIMDYTDTSARIVETARFTPEALMKTPAGAQFDWTLEEVLPTNEREGRVLQGPLYLLSGIKKE